MWRNTGQYVQGCDLCHQRNHQSGKPTGLQQTLPIAKGHWQRMGINFITDLQVSGNGHNRIVTFVDCMTKRKHWRSSCGTINTPVFARIFIEDIVCLHAVPQEVVLDHDVCFRADHLREVAWILWTKLLMFTAFNPEQDNISENSSQLVVCYLHGFTTHDQANWDDHLPLAEYAYNSSLHCSTKQMPFELDLSYEPPLPLNLIAHLQWPQAHESAKPLQGQKFVELGLQNDLTIYNMVILTMLKVDHADDCSIA